MTRLTTEQLVALRTTALLQTPYGSMWRHIKSGNTYKVETVAISEADIIPVVVYYRHGVIWTRPHDEFLKGFERV